MGLVQEASCMEGTGWTYKEGQAIPGKCALSERVQPRGHATILTEIDILTTVAVIRCLDDLTCQHSELSYI